MGAGSHHRLSVASPSGLSGCLFAFVNRALLAGAFVAGSLFAGRCTFTEVAVHVIDGPFVAAFRGGNGVDGSR
jgi:hypothetical protein